MAQSDQVLVWMDLEMTGLDPKSCAIVQMAIILTDTELEPLAEPLDVVVWQPESVLESMTPFVRDMHTKSGLIDKIRESPVAVEDAERMGLALITKYATYRTARLCGNSIGQDRRFLYEYMPSLESYHHYRQIDVSTLKELALWWYGERHEKVDPGGAKHTALYDIRQSIEELKFYRRSILKPVA